MSEITNISLPIGRKKESRTREIERTLLSWLDTAGKIEVLKSELKEIENDAAHIAGVGKKPFIAIAKALHASHWAGTERLDVIQEFIELTFLTKGREEDDLEL